MARKVPSTHPLNQSCLFKVPNPDKLAKVLLISKKALERLANTNGKYVCWEADKKSGGTRTIEAPHDDLKAIQKRIANVLQKIDPPHYLMAPVKGRSYVDNAAKHVGSLAFRLLDIEDFFPSCTDKRVYWFFHHKMQCAPHVAAILTKLTTYNCRLPQGSPCSPILAYFAYVDMWDGIDEIVTSSGCRLGIYADDISISGANVYERDIWAIKQKLHKYGHRYSRRKERSVFDKPVVITGVIVSGHELLLPNRQHQEMSRIRRARAAAMPGEVRQSLDRQFNGRVAQARQILRHSIVDATD